MNRKFSLKKLKIAPVLVINYGFFHRFLINLRYRKDPERKNRIKSLQKEIFKDKVLALFQRKFRKEIKESKNRILTEESHLRHEMSNKVWIYWAQGISAAPAIVKICVQSIMDYFRGGVGYTSF